MSNIAQVPAFLFEDSDSKRARERRRIQLLPISVQADGLRWILFPSRLPIGKGHRMVAGIRADHTGSSAVLTDEPKEEVHAVFAR